MRANLTIVIGLASALAMPAAAGPRRPIPAHRPADFGFRIEDGYGNCVDSDSGTVTKDLVMGPDTTIALRFTASEMDTVYDALVALEVFDLREPHPEFGQPKGSSYTLSNATDHRFEIRGRGLTKHFAWTDVELADYRRSPKTERFFKAMHIVRGILQRRPEYARLPPPRALRY